MTKKNKHSYKGQVIVEYTFCLIIVFLMVYSMIKIFRWSGTNLVKRQKDHQALLTAHIEEEYGCTVHAPPMAGGGCLHYVPESEGPLKQIDPYFSDPLPMNAIWLGD